MVFRRLTSTDFQKTLDFVLKFWDSIFRNTRRLYIENLYLVICSIWLLGSKIRFFLFNLLSLPGRATIFSEILFKLVLISVMCSERRQSNSKKFWKKKKKFRKFSVGFFFQSFLELICHQMKFRWNFRKNSDFFPLRQEVLYCNFIKQFYWLTQNFIWNISEYHYIQKIL